MNDYYDMNIKEWRLQEIVKCLAEHTDCTYVFYKDVLANKASTPINTIFQSTLTSETNFYNSPILSWNPFLPVKSSGFIHNLPIPVKHGILRILICHLLCILQHRIGTKLGYRICQVLLTR